MKAVDFASMGRERREEWRRTEETAAAMALVRELEATATKGVLQSASDGSALDIVARAAGFRMGIAKVIELLTEER